MPPRDRRKQEDRHELEDRRASTVSQLCPRTAGLSRPQSIPTQRLSLEAELISSERHYRLINRVEGPYAGELMTQKQYQYENPVGDSQDTTVQPHGSISLHDRREWGEEPMFLDSKHPRRPSKPFKPNWTSPSRTGALGVQEPTVFFKWQ